MKFRDIKPIILIVFLTALFFSGCNNTKPTCSDCNVIFILIDALRADHLGGYGYYRNTSPNMDKFAEGNIVFNNVRSQASCTFPSVNSILTSRHCFYFLGQEQGNVGIPENITSLQEILKEKNYHTIAISASPIVRKTPYDDQHRGGFGRGFDYFDEECIGKDASCINNKAFKFINTTEKPFFLYLHYMDVHTPYNKPDDYPEDYNKFAKEHTSKKKSIMMKKVKQVSDMIDNGSYYIEIEFSEEEIQYMFDLYDNAISYFDSQFKLFLDELDKKGLINNTIIIIASDHGDEFMEHNSVAHCHTLFNTETQVPIIMQIPSISQKGMRKALVQNLDITPTLLYYLGIDLSDYDFEGKSLRPVIESDKEINEYVFSNMPPLRSINNKEYKLIYDIQSQESLLYNIKDDSAETKNIINITDKNITKDLKENLIKWIHEVEGYDINESIRKGEELIEQLKALGYMT